MWCSFGCESSGFCGVHHQQAYFYFHVFNPLADTNRRTSFASCFQSRDREKPRTYELHVRQVERESFTPLVFSTLREMSKPTEITYKRLALLLPSKKIQTI